MHSIQKAFAVFAVMCFGWIFASLARGRARRGPPLLPEVGVQDGPLPGERFEGLPGAFTDGGAFVPQETVAASHEAGQLGVIIELAAGGSALVRFNTDSFGSLLVIYDGTGAELVRGDLAPGIADLPLLASP